MNDYRALLAFLKPLTEGLSGFMGVTRALRSEEPDDNKRWSEFANIFCDVEDGEIDLPEQALSDNPRWEWYFCPAVLSEPSRLQSKFKASRAIWIDFDEPVDWAAFEPAPSIVVQTSEQKHHCYWLLQNPITDVNDMRYWCRRLLENFDGGDVSGFDATQLLKLPWGLNLKLGSKTEGGEYFAPKVVKFEPELRYAESAFEHLEEPVKTLPAAIDLGELADVPDTEGSWQEALEALSDRLPEGLRNKVATRQDGGAERRSGALYSLTLSLLDEMPAVDVYRVLAGSPNDKFAIDHGPQRGSILLWKDICRVQAKRERDKANQGVAEHVADILNGKGSPRDKGRRVTEYAAGKLKETGRFIQDEYGTGFYVDGQKDIPVLYQVDTARTSPFAGLVARRFGLNAGVDHPWISGILHDATWEYQVAKKISFRHFAYYDEQANRVYVNKNDGQMYLLDGESVTLVPQGFDNVFFRRRDEDEYPKPFTYTPDYKPGGLNALIFDGPNYTTYRGSGVSEKQLKHILKTWVSTFFFPSMMNTKPIVLINGEADSGKTSFYQCLSVLFTGDSTFSVTSAPKDPKEFDTQVTQSHHVFYDNVEINRPEIQEKLAQVATGYSVKTRVLYSTNDLRTMRARAFVGITSITLDRIKKDVAQRYIIVPVHPYSLEKKNRRMALSLVLSEVMNHRDELWSELLDYVNKVVARISRHGLEQRGSSLRMADFGAFLQLTCEMAGLSHTDLEGFIRSMQAETMRENDVMFPAMKSLMEAGDTRRFKVGELYQELQRIDRKITKQYPTVRKFGSQLRAYVHGGQFAYDGIGVKETAFGKNFKYHVYNPADPAESDGEAPA